MQTTLDKGQRGEDLACEFLKKQGFSILQRNVRYPFAELDIVAQHQGILVFVEVRTRKSALFGLPKETVSLKKQRHVVMAAQAYLKDHYAKNTPFYRFDVVSILIGAKPVIEHIPNAFQVDFKPYQRGNPWQPF